MAWNIYRSTDAGAPVLTGQNQVGLNLLDAILTGPSGDGTGNAYGSKPCAGWVREMTSSTVKVFRPGLDARARQYFRVWQPNADPTGYVTGYTAMSDINTGTDPFPSATPPSQVVDKYALLPFSATTDGTARSWIVAGDDRTFVFLCKNGSTASVGRWYMAYYGEFYSYVTEDLYQTCIVAAPSHVGEARSPFGCYAASSSDGVFSDRTGVYICRNYDGSANSIMGNYAFHAGVQPRQGNQYGGQISGIFPCLNVADGRYWYTHMPLCSIKTLGCIRGVLRGVWMSCAQLDYNADQDQFDVTLPDGTPATMEMLYTYGNTDAGEATTFKGNMLIQIGGSYPHT